MHEYEKIPLNGLLRGIRLVAFRVPFVLLAWMIFLILAAPVLNSLVPGYARHRYSGVSALVIFLAGVGITIGYLLARNIVACVNSEGWGVAAIPVTGSLLVVLGGTYLATLIRPIGDWQLTTILLVVGISSVLWSIRMAMPSAD